jgi:hypothetical protein
MHGSECFERLIQRDEVVPGIRRDVHRFVERHFRGAAAAFVVAARASKINQDTSHHSRRHREEVRAILPSD